MTTTACAFNTSAAVSQSAFEIATITPGYAAVRAHRPLKSRMGSRAALLGSSVLAGVFGLFAAEAMAQQYNFSGSGGFTDVSSSINVVTDAGAGNIRVILADGVQFVAAPGQYQLNPMTNQLQVSTDILLGAYTGGAPVTAVQTSQSMMTSQAAAYSSSAPFSLQGQQLAQASFGAPTAMATYQPQVYTAGQYATQPSIVGGYQMQPSNANVAYNPPMTPNLNPQATQYVPAYSAGAQMAQVQPSFGGGAATTFGQTSYNQPAYGMQGGFGAQNMYGNAAPIPVTQAVPVAEIAAAPAPIASSGGMFGLPSWALVGGGVVAAGAAVMAMGGLGGGSSTGTTSTNANTSSNYSISQQAFLSDPAVQAALNGTSTTDDTDTTSNTSSSSTSSGTSDGIVISGGTDGGTTTVDSGSAGASATIAAGRENDDITGTSGDDTITFRAAEDAEEFNSMDLSGGNDTVVLEDMTSDVTPEDLNNVENLHVQVASSSTTLSLASAGDDVESVVVDANSMSITITDVDTVDTVAVSDAGTAMVTIEDVNSGNTVALTGSDNAKITGGSTLTLNVSDVNAEVEIATTTTNTLTIDVADSTDNAFDLVATAMTVLTVTGGGALTISNEFGDTELADVTQIDGSSATGAINVTVDGTTLTDVDTGSAGDMLHIKDSAAAATFSTNSGNDTVEIDAFGTTATLDTGSGGDKIELDTVIASGATIDGGEGSDTLEASKNITTGSYDNIETLEISGAASSVNLALFDGDDLSSIEIEVPGSEVTLNNMEDHFDIEATDGAEITFGASTDDEVTLTASGDLTLKNVGTGTSVLTEANISFVSNTASVLTLLDDGADVNRFTSITLDGTEGSVELAGAGFTDTSSELTTFDASAADDAILVGSASTDIDMATVMAFSTGDGDDMLYLSEIADNAIYELGDGDDTIEVGTGNSNSVRIYGGGGNDTIELDTSGNVDAKIYFTSMDDFVSGGEETVTGFDTDNDDIVIQIDGVNSITVETGVKADGAAAGVYVDDNADIIYVSDGTTVGVINVSGIDDTDVEIF